MREHVEAGTEPAPAPAPERAAPQAVLLRLQRSAGNRAVGRLLAREAAPAWNAEEIEAIQAYSQAWMDKTEASKRTAIVKLAASQEGEVKDAPGPDGKKIGHERLKQFYRVACPSYTPAYDKGIEGVGMWAGQQHAGEPRTGLPWSWCAIFCVWAIRQVTGIGSFAGQPIGLGRVHPFAKYKPDELATAIKPGDMICRREEYAIAGRDKPKDAQDLNHQCLVKSIDPVARTVTTINGNGPLQQIYERTEPLSYYWGFYDSLSETDVGAYEAQIRKDYSWAVKAREKAGLPGV